jgi:hypothetical protein
MRGRPCSNCKTAAVTHQDNEQKRRGKHTVTGLVPACGEYPPLLGLGGVGGDGLVEGVLPVLECENIELQLAKLRLEGSHGVVSSRVGNIRAHLAEEVLELGLVLLEGVLLGDSQGGQSRESEGEAHGCGNDKSRE